MEIKTERQFNTALQNAIRYNQMVVVEKKRASRCLIVNRKRLIQYRVDGIKVKASKDKIPKQAVALIRIVKNCFSRYLLSNGLWVEQIPALNGPYYKDRTLFKTLPVNAEFYQIDMKHAYWRCAYILGYITQKIYNRYAGLTHLKLYRNMSLSCVIAPKERTYYVAGLEPYTITEDSSNLFAQMYANIRHHTNNIVGDVYRKYPGKVLGYHTDCVYVLPEVLKASVNYIRNSNFLYRTKLCRKVSELQYEEAGKLKTF